MAYTSFYYPGACYRSIISPVFYIDGSPLYEDLGEGGLLYTSIQRNDVKALKLYNECAHTRVFLTSYGWDDSNPSYEAIYYDSFDVLRELFSIYRSSPSLTEPEEDYLKHFHISSVIEACATGSQEMASWLMDHDPLPGNLHDHDFDGQTALFRAAKALRKAGSLVLEAKHENIPPAQQQYIYDELSSFRLSSSVPTRSAGVQPHVSRGSIKVATFQSLPSPALSIKCRQCDALASSRVRVHARRFRCMIWKAVVVLAWFRPSYEQLACHPLRSLVDLDLLSLEVVCKPSL